MRCPKCVGWIDLCSDCKRQEVEYGGLLPGKPVASPPWLDWEVRKAIRVMRTQPAVEAARRRIRG